MKMKLLDSTLLCTLGLLLFFNICEGRTLNVKEENGNEDTVLSRQKRDLGASAIAGIIGAAASVVSAGASVGIAASSGGSCSIRMGIEIENLTRWPLFYTGRHCAAGALESSLPNHVFPGKKEAFVACSSFWQAKGVTFTFLWNIHETNLVIYTSIPYWYIDRKANVLGVGLKNGELKESLQNTGVTMFYDGWYARDKCWSAALYLLTGRHWGPLYMCNSKICLQGQFGSGFRSDARIVLLPRDPADADPAVKSRVDHHRWNPIRQDSTPTGVKTTTC